MTNDKELVPKEGELVSTDAEADTDLNKAFKEMAEQVEKAAVNMMFQNVQEVDMAARTAEALYTTWKKHASPHDQILLRIQKHLTGLYAPLTRAIVYQLEGRYSEASDEIAKGLTTSGDAIATIDEYAQFPNADEGVLQAYQPILPIFPIIFRGFDAGIRAEVVGYQGRIAQYVDLLREAVAEYRQIEKLPQSLNPTFLTLAGTYTSLADRLETRIQMFSSKQKQRYLCTTGHKIFVIHGHDEAKWRELRDLLGDRLGVKTVVLEEEPGAGEVLIRKFEEFADDCCYAFALLTPDDFVEKEGKSYFQARPNVLFELGWFYGHFGHDHVCIIKKANTVMPSDLAGILSINFRDQISEGFLQIEDELKRVGVINPSDRK